METTNREKGKKWTKEEVIQCARLCSSRTEFKYRFQSAYSCSLRNKWRDEACSHITPTRKPAGYWTKEKCVQESQKYDNRTDFSKQSSSAYNAAFLNGWLEECYSHMETLNVHWTREMCQDEALKYETKKEWRENSSKSYNASCRNGWMYEISLHLKNAYKPINYWTKDRCLEESLRFETKTEWEEKSVCSYRVANKNGWYAECCQHMSTDHYKGRNYWTLEKVLECSLLCKTRTEFQEKYKSAYQAAQKNRWFDIVYSHMETIQAPSGTWTKDNCIKEAQKYRLKNEFQKGSSGAYDSAARNGWLPECYAHMDVVGNLMIRALYIYEWKDGSVYVGLTHDYQERNTEHMKTDRYINKTKEFGPPKWIKLNEWMEAKEAAKKECELIKRYLDEGRDVLNKNAGGQLGGNNLYWTKERCLEKSKEFVKKSDFREQAAGAYSSAYNKGWIKECCFHMEQKRPNNYWTKERCLEEVKKYKTIEEFKKSEMGCHSSIYENGWQEELFVHYEYYKPRNKPIRI